MYDFIKIFICDPGLATALKQHSELEFKGEFNLKTSEAGETFIAQHHGLKFRIYPSGRIQIQGSLHKYWNKGSHNYNDFAFKDAINTIDKLKEQFGVEPERWRIEHIEFGVNLTIAYPPSHLLKSLIVFKNTPFDKMEIHGRGEGKKAVLGQYAVKIYNKGMQYGNPNNILRIERKIRKIENLSKTALHLADLMDKEFFLKCQDILLDTWNNVILCENVNKKALTTAELDCYQTCINPKNWETMSPKQRHTHRLRYASIIAQHSKSTYKADINELLDKKRELLSN